MGVSAGLWGHRHKLHPLPVALTPSLTSPPWPRQPNGEPLSHEGPPHRPRGAPTVPGRWGGAGAGLAGLDNARGYVISPLPTAGSQNKMLISYPARPEPLAQHRGSHPGRLHRPGQRPGRAPGWGVPRVGVPKVVGGARHPQGHRLWNPWVCRGSLRDPPPCSPPALARGGPVPPGDTGCMCASPPALGTQVSGWGAEFQPNSSRGTQPRCQGTHVLSVRSCCPTGRWGSMLGGKWVLGGGGSGGRWGC